MKILDVKQGTEAWHKERASRFTASEAQAMMGCSKYMSRDELLRMKATGERKSVSAATQRLFGAGHDSEAAARPIVEKMIGDELFPVTAVSDDEKMLASFDGVNFEEDLIWEHKLWNESLASCIRDGVLPETHLFQVEHQLLVSGADKCIFTVSDGTEDKMVHLEYESSPDCRKNLILGWKQFAKDLKNWKPQEIVVEPVAEKVEALPSLNVQIEGGVTASNLETYEKNALAFIGAINTDLQTDSDFANADAIVKFCGKTEKELDRVKQAALDQTADIATLFKTIDNLKAEMRSKRLELDKLVKSRKAAIKKDVVREAEQEFHKHLDKLDERLSAYSIKNWRFDCKFEDAVKNKRTFSSLRNAVNTELATLKIEANELCDKMESNAKALEEIAGEYGFLFRDIQQIITKDREDLLNLAKQRIAEHKVEDEKRVAEMSAKAIAEEKRVAEEDERIRLEEEAKANASNKVSSKKSVESKPNQETNHPDYDYFRTQIGIILTNMDNYTKDELRTAFRRLAEAV